MGQVAGVGAGPSSNPLHASGMYTGSGAVSLPGWAFWAWTRDFGDSWLGETQVVGGTEGCLQGDEGGAGAWWIGAPTWGFDPATWEVVGEEDLGSAGLHRAYLQQEEGFPARYPLPS